MSAHSGRSYVRAMAKMRTRRAAALVLGVLAAGALMSPASAAPSAGSLFAITAVDLGVLPGDESGIANAVNDFGVAVGTTGPLHVGPESHAVLWRNGRVVELGQGEAVGVNNAGQAIGNGISFVGSGNRRDKAMLWAHGRATALVPDAVTSTAWAISERGHVVVSYGDEHLDAPQQLAVWHNGALTDLHLTGALAGFPEEIHVDDAGRVAGWTRSPGMFGQPGHAFACTAGGDCAELPRLDPTAFGFAFVTGIGPAGSAYGWTIGADGMHAVRWQNGQASALLPGEPVGREPRVSSDGRYVAAAAAAPGDPGLGVLLRGGREVGRVDLERGMALLAVSRSGAVLLRREVWAGPEVGEVWSNGAVQRLPGLGGDDRRTFPMAMNDTGAVVGASGYNASTQRPTLWRLPLLPVG